MPSIITWDDKETFEFHPEIPEKNKVTAQNMNDLKNSINGIIIESGVVSFFKSTSDITGVIDDPKLQDRRLSLIIGGGIILEEGIHFSKADDSTVVMEPDGLSVLHLATNYSYTLFTTLT